MIDKLVPQTHKTQTFVSCDSCRKEMDVSEKRFFTFLGNVHVGLTGGIIGNSLDDEMRVTRGLVYCFDCTLRILGDAIRYENGEK